MKAKLLLVMLALAGAAPASASVSVQQILAGPHRAASVQVHNATEAVFWWVGFMTALDEANGMLDANATPLFSFRLRASYNRNIAEVVGGVGGRDNYIGYVQFMGRADLFEMFADFIGEPPL